MTSRSDDQHRAARGAGRAGRRPRPLVAALSLVAVCGALAAGCGDGSDASGRADSRPRPADRSSTTTTAAPSTTDASATSLPFGDGTAPSTTVDESSWVYTATVRRGDDGAIFGWDCSPDGTPAAVWGTGVYSDDSSICTAAVHAGIITLEAGGRVTVEIRPGQSAYTGSEANGIRSSDYGQWGGSFRFVRG